jgi:SH3-like domain-containing protein
MGQGRIRAAAPLAAALALAACGNHGDEGGDCPASVAAKTPSGYCVPRYLSLKRGDVFGRTGPGKDYPPKWIYHVKGLPVQVIEDTRDWRRICDPDGTVTWVSRAMVDGRRTVMSIAKTPNPIRGAPKAEAGIVGYLSPRALADLDRCHGGWCKVSVGGVHGWVETAGIWGTAPAPQCH